MNVTTLAGRRARSMLSEPARSRFFLFLVAVAALLALSVGSAQAAGTDNLADAPELGPGLSGDFGNTDFLSTEANEPAHAGVGPFHSAWLKWTAPASPPASLTIGLCHLATFNSVVGVYTSATNPGTYPLTPVASDNDNCGTSGGGARVKFSPAASTTYFIAIAGTGIHPSSTPSDENGQYDMHMDFTPANDDFGSASTISAALPQTVTGSTTGGTSQPPDEPLHAGVARANSVWWKWTAPASPASQTVTASTCESGQDTLLGVYEGASLAALNTVASSDNDCGNGFSSQASFTAQANHTYYVAVAGKPNSIDTGGQDEAITLSLAGRPSNDDLSGASAVSALPLDVSTNNSGASAQSNENAHAGTAAAKSVWYRWTAPSSGTIEADTCGGLSYTRVAVYQDGTSFPLTPISNAAADPGCDSNNEGATFQATSGTKYLIAVDAVAGGGDVELHLKKQAPDTTIDSGPNGPTRDKTPTFTFSSTPAGASFQCSVDSGTASYSSCTSPFTAGSLSDGNYTFRVRAVDSSPGGSTDASPATRQFTVDTKGPTVKLKTKPKKKIKTKAQKVKVKFRFGAEVGATLSCKMDRSPAKPCKTNATRSYKVKRGKHHFSVKAKDAAGNTGKTTKFTFRVVKKR